MYIYIHIYIYIYIYIHTHIQKNNTAQLNLYDVVLTLLTSNVDDKTKKNQLGTQLHVALLSFYAIFCPETLGKQPKRLKLLKNDHFS